jgi:methionyl-tRNA formyltransferase
MKPLRIVFMGTPDFAAGVLDCLVRNGLHVAGVVTAPDRPAGRGQKVAHSSVKQYALEHGLPLLQPVNLKDEGFLSELRKWRADVQVVVAFRMLPEAVWRMPERGTFNLHASLLPQYRGAAPINWAIINGEKNTGVTTFFIDDKIDTGAVILRDETQIGPAENAGQLHDRLMVLGCGTVIRTLEAIAGGNVVTMLQEESGSLKPAPKLSRENTRIDWNKGAGEIFNLIRGLSPYPAAWTTFIDGDSHATVKIYDAKPSEAKCDRKPGSIETGKKSIRIATADVWLDISALQLPGKKRMTAAELLNGTGFSVNAQAV